LEQICSGANCFGGKFFLDSQGACSILQKLFKAAVTELLRYPGFQASRKTLQGTDNKMVLITQSRHRYFSALLGVYAIWLLNSIKKRRPVMRSVKNGQRKLMSRNSV